MRHRIVELGLAVSLGVVFVCGCEPSRVGTANGSAASNMVPKTFANARPSLEAGERIPDLQCQGWFNGAPPQFEGKDPNRLFVIDVWARWCPVSAECAPHLVHTYEKFKDKNVSFVSVTADPENAASWLAGQCSMPWVHGYGLDLNTVQALGALNSTAPARGYEVKPTLYLVRSDGSVLWCDKHARMRHVAPEPLMAELEAAIEEQLAANSVDPPPATPVDP